MIRISFAGDIMLGRTFNDILKSDTNFNLWGNTKNHTEKSDLFIANLETTICDENVEKWPNKTFNYRLYPKYASNVLGKSGLDYVSLANNHTLDFQKKGLLQTLKTLAKHKIEFSGAGLTKKSATEPAVFSLRKFGKPIFIFSAADHYDYWESGVVKGIKGTEGIWYIDKHDSESQSELLIKIQQTKKEYPDSFIIVSLHWGHNYEYGISNWKKQFARQLINSGTNIIHGHSAHHIQPIERIGNGCVFYSMGDYIDDYAVTKEFRNDLAFLADVYINPKNNHIVDIKTYPTRIRNYEVNFINKTDNSGDYDFVMKHLKIPF